MNAPVTMKWNVRFPTQTEGRRVPRPEPNPDATRSPVGRVPRISRLIARAIKMDWLVRAGRVKDYAELARLGNVSRVRVTQIMNLNQLAPSIQKELLFLPRTVRGRDAITLRDMQAIGMIAEWREQVKRWQEVPIGSINRVATPFPPRS